MTRTQTKKESSAHMLGITFFSSYQHKSESILMTSLVFIR